MSTGLLSSYTDGAVMSTALKPPIPNLQTLHMACIIYPNLTFVKYQTLQTLYKTIYKIVRNVQ